VTGGSQCGETAAAATGMDGSAAGIAGAAVEVGAAVPQTWQNAEPGARLLPHFEQNIDDSVGEGWISGGDVTGSGEMKKGIRGEWASA
jgi:hypothetical protein